MQKIYRTHDKVLLALDMFFKDSIMQTSAQIGVSDSPYSHHIQENTKTFQVTMMMVGNVHVIISDIGYNYFP